MRNLLAALILLVSVVLAGCGNKWVVVRQASPNPMASSSRFIVEKAALDPSFRVGEKTEGEWMGEKGEGTQESWAGDKAAMAEMFVEGFMNEKEGLGTDVTPGAGVFTVRARYVHYDPGFYAVVASAPAALAANVEVLDANGQIVDVIRIEVKNSAIAAGTAARACAREIGAVSAKYLKERLGR